MKEYENWIGKQVTKTQSMGKAPKPFKSGLKVNTVKGIIEHPNLPGKPAFTFVEDESYVRCSTCELVP